MVKKIFICILCVILTLSCCACAKEKGGQTSVEAKGIYLVENTEENKISVKLPTDYEFNEAQIQFIEDFVSSILLKEMGKEFNLTRSDTAIETDAQSYTGYYIDIESKTTYVSDDIVSIVFTGLYNFKNAAHPNHWLFALNFDPKTMKKINFASIHPVNDELYNMFAEKGEQLILEETGGSWPAGFDTFSKTLCSKRTFFDGLNGKTLDVEWYCTNDGIVFSYSVPYALGNHKEVELQIEHK